MNRPTRAGLTEQLDHCASIVALYPAGVPLRRLHEDIWSEIGESIPRRTLMRRLRELVEEGRLVKRGRTNRCRYHVAERMQHPHTIR